MKERSVGPKEKKASARYTSPPLIRVGAGFFGGADVAVCK